MKEKEIVDHIENLFSLATAGIDPQRRKWVANYRYWKAMNKIERPSYKDNPRVPLIFRYTNGIISILTYGAPKYDFRPQERQDIETANALNEIFGDYYWEKLKMSKESEDLIWYAVAISGSGLFKWGIDRLTNEQYVRCLNSFCCYPDPCAKDLDSLNFFIYYSMWSLAEIKYISPERGKEVKEQQELNQLTYDEEVILSPWARESQKSENLIGVLDKEDMKKDYGRAMLFEVWEKDMSTEKIPIDADEIIKEHEMIRQGQMPELSEENHHPEHILGHQQFADSIAIDDSVPSDYLQIIIEHLQEHTNHPNALRTERLKYPRGKTTVMANKVVLEEPKPAPLGLAMAKMDFIRNPLSFWGQTITEYAQSLQDSRERRKRQIADHADRTANPREFYLSQSGYDPRKVRNVAGEQVELLIPNSVWWEQTPNMNPYIMEDMIDSEKTIEKIMSYPEVMQGEKPPGTTSGVLIQELKESLGPEMAKATRHYEWCLSDVARGQIEMMQTESPTRVYLLRENPDQPLYINQDDLNLGGEYDIRIKPGSTLPTSRQAKDAKALQYFQAGLYTRRAALEYSDDPQAQRVIEEWSEINMLQQENEQLKGIVEQLGKQNEILQKATTKTEEGD